MRPKSSNRSNNLNGFFSPLSPETFKAKFFEKKILFQEPTDERTQLVRQITITPESLLKFSFDPDFVMLLRQTGVPLENPEKTEILKANRLATFFKEDGSVVVRRVQSLDPTCKKLTDKLKKAFGIPVTMNAYLTPPRVQTFAKHWDDHDVLVLQLAGSKKWNIYSPFQKYPLKPGPDPYPSQVLKSFELTPGAFLYLPSGYSHEAIADSESSLHLTIGFSAVRKWEGLNQIFQEILKQAAQDDFFRGTFTNFETVNTKSMNLIHRRFMSLVRKNVTSKNLRRIQGQIENEKNPVETPLQTSKRQTTRK